MPLEAAVIGTIFFLYISVKWAIDLANRLLVNRRVRKNDKEFLRRQREYFKDK